MGSHAGSHSGRKHLFAQMRVWREQLFNQIFRYNEKLGLTPEQVDGFIQRPKDENISALVDKILIATAKNPLADVSKLERQIDQSVYLLYNLTPEEIKLVEEKV
jgi:hypothetical protein